MANAPKKTTTASKPSASTKTTGTRPVNIENFTLNQNSGVHHHYHYGSTGSSSDEVNAPQSPAGAIQQPATAKPAAKVEVNPAPAAAVIQPAAPAPTASTPAAPAAAPVAPAASAAAFAAPPPPAAPPPVNPPATPATTPTATAVARPNRVISWVLGITALIFALLALIALYFYGRDHGWWNIASLPPANISAAAPPAATPPPASVNPAQGVPAPTPGNIQLQLSCADKPWQYSATEDTVTARCIDEKSSDNSVQPPAADEEESSPPPADPANVPVPEPKPEIQKVCGCGEVEKPRVYRQPDKPKKKVYRSVETACLMRVQVGGRRTVGVHIGIDGIDGSHFGGDKTDYVSGTKHISVPCGMVYATSNLEVCFEGTGESELLRVGSMLAQYRDRYEAAKSRGARTVVLNTETVWWTPG
jgi:hypothetical protein